MVNNDADTDGKFLKNIKTYVKSNKKVQLNTSRNLHISIDVY